MIIAIVDDDRNLLKALGRLLAERGYEAELFASAEEFLTAAPTSKADCLVLDMQLGEMSGLDVVRRLSEAGIKLPVICMSGSLQDKFRRAAFALGCFAYLAKPFDPDLLLATLEKATRAKPPSKKI
jgi:FixJ family two-component response regulator